MQYTGGNRMKKLKVNTVKRIFNEIGNILNIDIELFLPEEEKNEKIINVYMRDNYFYGSCFTSNGTRGIYINNRLIHKMYEFNPYNLMQSLKYGLEYIPGSLEIATAMVMIHEYTHAQINSEQLEKSGTNLSVKKSYSEFIDALERHSMLEDYTLTKVCDEELDKMHDQHFIDAYTKNVFKCWPVISKLEVKC